MGVLPALPTSSELVSGRSPGSQSGDNRTRPFLPILSPWAPQKLPSDPFWPWPRPAAMPSTEPDKREREPRAAAEPPSSAAAHPAAPARKGSTGQALGSRTEALFHGG